MRTNCSRTRYVCRTALILVLLASPFRPPAVAETVDDRPVSRPSAIVAAVEGSVWIVRAESGKRVPADLGLRLRTGDEVRAEENAAVTIYFSGGHIVRVPAGNRLEIVKDPGTAGAAVRTAARMSARSLSVLENGLWKLSDPAGDMLLVAPRGNLPPYEAMRAGTPGFDLLSPRNETIVSPAPNFYWRAERRPVRVVVDLGAGEQWRSEPVVEPSLRYVGETPLEPGKTYRWWIENPEGTRRLADPAVFTTPSTTLAGDIKGFELEVSELDDGESSGSLADFLRCAYYERLGAWSVLLQVAYDLSGSNREPAYQRRAIELARRELNLTRGNTATLAELLTDPDTGGDRTR